MPKNKWPVLLWIILLTACGPAPAVTSAPTTATMSPTRQVTPLPKMEDYIIYAKYNAANEYEIWAINPNELIPHLITSDNIPRSWSPSNKQWLFTRNGSIYVTNTDGSDIHTIYTNNEYKGIDPFWLTEDVILFNAYRDILSPPDMYSVDIGSGKVTQLFPGSNQFIVITFPADKALLRGDWSSGSLDMVNKDGNSEKFFNDFEFIPNPYTPHQEFQRIGKLDKYLFRAKRAGDANSKLWLASKQEPPQLLFDPENENIYEFAVSPNEKYIALTYENLENKNIYIYSLENLQVVFKWAYPYKLSDAYFTWSPDSQSIVVPYSDYDIGGTSHGIDSGIQVMNIKTGETRKILKENVAQIIDWHSLK